MVKSKKGEFYFKIPFIVYVLQKQSSTTLSLQKRKCAHFQINNLLPVSSETPSPALQGPN